MLSLITIKANIIEQANIIEHGLDVLQNWFLN